MKTIFFLGLLIAFGCASSLLDGFFEMTRFAHDPLNYLQDARDALRQSTTCANSTYLNLGDTCSSNSGPACKSGLDCVSSMGSAITRCALTSINTQCTVSADCGSNFVCAQQHCFPLGYSGDPCIGNDTCYSSNCVAGTCVSRAVGQSCSTGECARGSFCNAQGICTAGYALGSNCTNEGPLLFASPADFFEVCSGGLCDISLNTVAFTFGTGTCTGVGSKPAGSQVGNVLGLACAPDTYTVEDSATNSVCRSSAVCNDQLSCNTVSTSTCACSADSSANGTCQSHCSTQNFAYINCLFKDNSANGGYLGLVDIMNMRTNSNAYKNCLSVALSELCCEYATLPASTYQLPNTTCTAATGFITGAPEMTSTSSASIVVLSAMSLLVALLF